MGVYAHFIDEKTKAESLLATTGVHSVCVRACVYTYCGLFGRRLELGTACHNRTLKSTK